MDGPVRKIILENFQAHKKLVVSLDPHVTTIVGPSDVGKSAIIRALKWALLNKPPSDIIRRGAKEVEVRVLLPNGKLTRTRSATKNTYTFLPKEQEEPELFEAFGQGVPEAVSKYTKMDSINFQSQHDGLFWFSETAGEVSRQLNQIVDLDIIDKVLASLSTRTRRTQVEVQVGTERLKQAEEKREELKYIREMGKDFDALQSLRQKATETRQRSTELDAISRTVAQYYQASTRLAQATSDAVALQEKAEQLAEIRKTKENLENTLRQGWKCRKQSEKSIPDLSPLEILYEEMGTAVKRRKDLRNLLNEIKDGKEIACQKTREAKEAESLLHKNLKGTCPLCGMIIES